MTVVETIQQKIYRLPLQAQQEVLEIVEQVESRYQTEKKAEHPLTLIANIAIDMGVTDLAERHDFYCHGKLED
jgi:hypothetical protein